jgi:HD-like signal output (HDOD) protein
MTEADLGFALVRDQVERDLDDGKLAMPALPEVAVHVVGSGTKATANAGQLAQIIGADAALSRYVLRIAACAAKRPAAPILSLQHAIAWLGLDEVSNIAFTLALQGRLLGVGQQARARRLWRHSLASALWSRQLAHRLSGETGLCYLCGLLHDIGKVIALGAISEVAQRANQWLGAGEYDRLIAVFHRDVGRRVLMSWALPLTAQRVIAVWEDYRAAGELRWAGNVVNLAHKLADFILHEPAMLMRDALMADPAYRDLGLTHEDGEALFDSASAINAELDRYLSP